MTFYVLTLFPKTIEAIASESILKRAVGANLISIKTINIRDFAKNRHKTVDDKPYGGGQGMILKVDTIIEALESIKPKPYSILLSASGKKYDQKKAIRMSKKESVALICGHYEGVDARVERFVDEILSIGDFVLTGGEIAALAVIDSISRQIPGVINKGSLLKESFRGKAKGEADGQFLEYPQYTRPQTFRGYNVPKILISGNHVKISKWQQKESIKRTKKFRKDLLK